MAVTENLYTGDGSTVLYSFTFPYLETTDVKVSLDGVDTTAYTLANATQVQLDAAPASGVAIKIYRSTDSATIYADFFPGASVKSSDLNTNFDQVLYVGQEAQTSAENTLATAQSAVTTANNAVTTANSAVTTANAATTTANNAVSTANSAVTTADSAVVTANTANTTANSAVSTANQAVTTATTLGNAAQSTADGAVVTADAALAAVAAAIDYDPCANVSAIPTVTVATYLEVIDSTGIESFTPLTGVPSGFVGDSGLTVRIAYDPSQSTWDFVQYFAIDPESRYFSATQGNTATTDIAQNASDISANTTSIATKMPIAGGTFTGNVAFDGDATFKGNGTTGSGEITLNCENNSHGVKVKGPAHSAAASYTLTLPDAIPTVSGQALTSDTSGNLSFSTVDARFIETPKTLSTDKIIPPNINAGMMGPIVVVPTGVTISVGANSRLTMIS